MTKVREIMSTPMAVVDDDEYIKTAAQLLTKNDVGAVPVRGAKDGRLKGMLTDRDIVVKVVATGMDPASVRVSEIATESDVVTVGADDSVEEAAQAMKRHRVCRVPVIEGHAVAGILTQADIARSRPDGQLADLREAISS